MLDLGAQVSLLARCKNRTPSIGYIRHIIRIRVPFCPLDVDVDVNVVVDGHVITLNECSKGHKFLG